VPVVGIRGYFGGYSFCARVILQNNEDEQGEPMRPRIERVDLTDSVAKREVEDFCHGAGLPKFAPIKGNVLAQFAMRDSENDIGAVARLEIILDHPFVEEVAVRADLRRKGLGKKMVGEVLEEARRRGIRTIWAMARAPNFFRGIGFGEEPDGEFRAEMIEGCEKCPDYLRVCNPVLFKKNIDK